MTFAINFFFFDFTDQVLKGNDRSSYGYNAMTAIEN